jgi:hypothetical protein
MKLGHDHCLALAVFRGGAEIVQIRKDSQGPGYMVYAGRHQFGIQGYDERLDVYSCDGRGRHGDILHVVATADRIDFLPHPGRLTIPDKQALDEALPSLRSEIACSRLSGETKDYLANVLSGDNSVALAYTCVRQTSDSVRALRLAINKVATLDASILSGMETRIRERVTPPSLAPDLAALSAGASPDNSGEARSAPRNGI